ncbi:twin-arginine translocase TatA/TatE family subunit [[Eubacterium] cellulosolvens]
MAFIGPWEIALIIVVVLILFGPKKLPELAKSVGNAIRQYREASEGMMPTGPQTTSAPTPTPADDKRILLETAKKLGIKTEGKTPDEISQEIVKKTTKKPRRRKTKAKK